MNPGRLFTRTTKLPFNDKRELRPLIWRHLAIYTLYVYLIALTRATSCRVENQTSRFENEVSKPASGGFSSGEWSTGRERLKSLAEHVKRLL
jgi:hypothetical protein